MKVSTWVQRHPYWSWNLGVFLFFGLLGLAYIVTDLAIVSEIIAGFALLWIIGLQVWIEYLHLKKVNRSMWFLLLTPMALLGLAIVLSLKEKG